MRQKGYKPSCEVASVSPIFIIESDKLYELTARGDAVVQVRGETCEQRVALGPCVDRVGLVEEYISFKIKNIYI